MAAAADHKRTTLLLEVTVGTATVAVVLGFLMMPPRQLRRPTLSRAGSLGSSATALLETGVGLTLAEAWTTAGAAKHKTVIERARDRAKLPSVVQLFMASL